MDTHMKQHRLRLLVSVLPLLLAIECDYDHGIAPLPGTLAVDVIFLNASIPLNTEGVYLFVAPVFPPHAINELYMNPNSLPLELDSDADSLQEYQIYSDTVSTEMVLPYGHYEALGLWWYNKETTSNLADILSLKVQYSPQGLQTYQFDITPDQPFHKTSLYANPTHVDRDATIKGTITFNGPFPENTLATAIAAYIRRPEAKVEYLLYLKSMDFSIDENPYHYTLPVKNGRVEYLVVFWISDRAGLDDFKTIGFYQDPPGSGEPGVLILGKNQTVTGIDINADWSLITP